MACDVPSSVMLASRPKVLSLKGRPGSNVAPPKPVKDPIWGHAACIAP